VRVIERSPLPDVGERAVCRATAPSSSTPT
jgi:hypothetical protein